MSETIQLSPGFVAAYKELLTTQRKMDLISVR